MYFSFNKFIIRLHLSKDLHSIFDISFYILYLKKITSLFVFFHGQKNNCVKISENAKSYIFPYKIILILLKIVFLISLIKNHTFFYIKSIKFMERIKKIFIYLSRENRAKIRVAIRLDLSCDFCIDLCCFLSFSDHKKKILITTG